MFVRTAPGSADTVNAGLIQLGWMGMGEVLCAGCLNKYESSSARRRPGVAATGARRVGQLASCVRVDLCSFHFLSVAQWKQAAAKQSKCSAPNQCRGSPTVAPQAALPAVHTVSE